MTIKIVLVEPTVPGNIGSVARVMKNFGFKDLVLINPQTEISGDTYRFAVRAQDILDNMSTYDSLEDFIKTIPYVVGTTAKIIKDQGSTNARVAMSSDDPSLINLLQFKDDVAILFGREDSGLTNKEIQQCDMTVHIPTSEEYKALNLAQAVTIILYSLHIKKEEEVMPTNYRSATREEKESLVEWFEKSISVLNFRKRKEEILVRRFRNIIGRAFVSGREAVSLVGVFSKTYKQIKQYEELKNKK
ncbi:MAG: RNA methyltransferase [Candidatus Heimdallarchaeota archaeon]|nr:RNA methyltransferase [Candidatus Heimdallarchaeota archaeon]